MAHKGSFGLALAGLLLSSLGAAVAQSAGDNPADEGRPVGSPVSRIAGDWRSSDAVVLSTVRPDAIAAAADLGPAPPGERLERMLLLLAPSATQRQALTKELENQQNPASAAYHHWLTPEAFADAYGNSRTDVSAVADWLRRGGFTVAPPPAGRGWIEFSGTVAQVEQAFHTQIHSATTAGGTRAVLVGSFSVPGALSPLIEGLVSLDGAVSTPALTAPVSVKASAIELASESSLSHAEALTPQLAEQLLHLDVLHASGVRGAGEQIAIAARSNVRSEDVAAFRAAFGLPLSAVEVKLSGGDPGRNSDEAEAVLAASWAGAAAPGARIVLVPAATTSATDGVDLSLAAIVDLALSHTVAVGYSSCEAALGPAHQAFYAALYRQAAAEGIAVIAATGDSGPAACRAAGSDAPVTSGYGVNALASTPWNTAVGTAAFSSANTSALTGWSPVNAADPAYAGGGGRSELYGSPDWQPIPGPQLREAGAQHRLLPDLVLPTAIDTGVNRGLAFCLSGDQAAQGCSLVRSGGSSAAAALFAGISALVAQKYGPQGNLAPHLYELSRENGVIDDVQEGNARLYCAAGSPGCGATGQIGFAAGPGFDLATGLGAVNAQALVARWNAVPATGKGLVQVENTTGTSQTINPSGSVILSAKVVSQTGGPAPTGTISFFDQSSNSNVAVVTLVKENALASTATVTLTGVLTQGGHPIQANYSGDSNYAAADSQPVVVEVEPSSTTTTVTPETYTPTAGSTLAVSAVITSLDAGIGASPPTGTVDFRLDGVSQGVKQVVPGSPSTANTLIEVPSSGGSHQIVGFYSGDNNYYNSTSSAVTITVKKTATTLSLSPSTTTPFAGSSLMLTATITAPPGNAAEPTGSITFTLDGVSQGAGVVTPGSPSSATLTITVPSTGTHTLGATYSGDSNYTGSTASPVTITVAKSPTTLAITPATTTPAPGSSLLVTATLTALYPGSTLPSGTVTFTLDGTKLGTGSVTGGSTASITFNAPATGSHTLQATYSGDSYYATSTSSTVTIIVAKIPTTLVVTPATTTPPAGSSLGVTATITFTGTATTQPTGTVTFTLDGTTVGTDPVMAGSPSTASITIPSLAPGPHVLQGMYSGDTYFGSSTSAAVAITVAKSPTSTTVTPATTTPTAGGSLQVTASIVPTNPGTTEPTGTVTFSLDGTSVGTQTVTPGSPSTATVTIQVLSAGTHLLVATYSGDTYYATSTSPTVTLIVAKGATVTTVTASPPILTAGITETLTATITPVNPITGAVYTITGTVSFYDGGTTLLGRVPVSDDTASLTGVALANNLNHSITAIYSGDTNWLPSTSAALLLSASTLPDTVVLTSNVNIVPPGQPVVLVATVTPNAPPAAGGEQNPTGNVVFYYGTTVLATVALVPSALNDSSTATLTITLPGGQDTLTAFYVGDLYYDAELSNAITIDVQSFTIFPVPGQGQPLDIIQGGAGSAQFEIEGYGGFNNQIQVVCAVPAQDDMTCTVTPSVVNPTAIVTVTVQTYSTGTSPPGSSSTSSNQKPAWPRAAGGAALALLGFFLLPFGRRARLIVEQKAGRQGRRFLTLLLLLAGLGGAGLGCSSVSQPIGSGTPLGVATLKITAASYVDNTVYSQSVYLAVDVLKPGSTAD
jgi:subtilase family serine protease